MQPFALLYSFAGSLTKRFLWDTFYSMKYELRSTEQFDKWAAKLKDPSVKIKVLARLDRVENGNFGDFKKSTPNCLNFVSSLGVV